MQINLTPDQVNFLMLMFRYIDQSGFFGNAIKEFKGILEEIQKAQLTEKKN